MSFDAHKNFAITSVTVPPSPASSGTSLSVSDATGFPAVPFNATVWPSGVSALSSNAEIVRVTGIAANVLTITRIQESTSARSVIATDQIAATITAKSLTDIEGNSTFTSVTLGSGSVLADVSGSGKVSITGTTPMIQVGGTAATFPAIKRSTTQLQGRLADDSADCDWSGAIFTASTAFKGPGTVASTGDVRLKNTGSINWRNFGDSADIGNFGIRAVGRSAAQVAAVASVATFTVGASDGSFEVSANVLVTTATSHAFSVTCAYTDEGNTARTLTMTFGLVAGGVTTISVANATGAVPYMGVPLHIRCKTATTITIATTGTFTTVTYNVEGIIKQIG